MPAGRPRTLDRKAIGDEICRRVSEGELSMDVCESLGVAGSTPWRYATDDPEFAAAYELARQLQSHALGQMLIKIAAGQDALTQFYKQAIAEEEERLTRLGVRKVKVIIRALLAAVVQRDRLRVDTLKWYCAKLAPRTYGDKIDLTSGGEPIRPPQHMTVEYIEPGAASMPALPPGLPIADVPAPEEL